MEHIFTCLLYIEGHLSNSIGNRYIESTVSVVNFDYANDFCTDSVYGTITTFVDTERSL